MEYLEMKSFQPIPKKIAKTRFLLKVKQQVGLT